MIIDDTITEINDSNVTIVENNKFKDCQYLTNVKLNKATYIGDNAFEGCISLTNVFLPNATEIGNNAFNNCQNLIKLTLQKAKDIGDNAFEGCEKLTEVTLSNAIKIGNNAFNHCQRLTKLYLSTAICVGTGAFRNCQKLTKLYLSNITKIGIDAFAQCTGLIEVVFPSATDIGNNAFAGCEKITKVVFPNAKLIGNNAFAGCAGLTKVVFPNATDIGNNAFAGCTGLTEVDLPNATHIGDNAFAGCIRLIKVNFPNETHIGDNAFAGCKKLPFSIQTSVPSSNLPTSSRIEYLKELPRNKRRKFNITRKVKSTPDKFKQYNFELRPYKSLPIVIKQSKEYSKKRRISPSRANSFIYPLTDASLVNKNQEVTDLDDVKIDINPNEFNRDKTIQSVKMPNVTPEESTIEYIQNNAVKVMCIPLDYEPKPLEKNLIKKGFNVANYTFLSKYLNDLDCNSVDFFNEYTGFTEKDGEFKQDGIYIQIGRAHV